MTCECDNVPLCIYQDEDEPVVCVDCGDCDKEYDDL